MRYASAGMITLLATGGPYLMADLYTLTLQSGTIYRWCDGDAAVTYNANTYSSVIDQGGLPVIERGGIRQARGLEVSTMDLTLYTEDTAQILGINAARAAHNGALDSAYVRVERAFMPTWGNTTNGTIILFEGSVASVDIGSTRICLHVKSALEKFSIQMPRNLFTPACMNCFGDASCGISLASLTLAGTVTAGATSTVIGGATSKATNYYQNGVCTFTSGACTGASCAIAASTGGTLTLVTPLPVTPSTGDTFTAYPGCARTVAACTAYSNSARFRGFPYVPPPETSL